MTARTPLEPERDDTLEALQEALAVVPSAALAAQIRERVRVEPIGSAHVVWWRPMLAAVPAVIVVVAALVWTFRTGDVPSQIAAKRVATSAEASRTPAGPRVPAAVAPAVPPAQPLPGAIAAALRPRPVTARAVRRGSAEGDRGSWRMEVLVSGDERRALDRLLLAMRAGTGVVPAPAQTFEDDHSGLPEPRLIEIPLLKPITPLAIGPVEHAGSTGK